MTPKQEAARLIDTINSGWQESMWQAIEDNADELGLCPADIGMLYQHMNGTDEVEADVLAMLRKIAD